MTMADAQYRVVFRGEISGEQPEETVKRNLAALFKMPEERVEGLFTGKPVVIKKGVDEATARKLEQAFRKAGAVCELHDVSSGRADQPSPGTAGTSTEAKPASRKSAAEARAGGGSEAASAAPAGSIAAAGDPNQTVVAKPVPQQLGDLSMGEPGEALVKKERDRTPPPIDTSDLSISDEPLGDGRRTTGEAPEIDTSDLQMLPPDA
jgi:hypothetical protein